MSPRLKLTQTLYGHLSKPPYSLEEAMILWWTNIRPTGGYRLTKYGWEVFTKELDLEYHTVELDPKEVTTKFLLGLDRKLASPFYIEKKKIHLFGSREAVMVIMHGSMSHFLKSLQFTD
jgi:hypothetical protein